MAKKTIWFNEQGMGINDYLPIVKQEAIGPIITNRKEKFSGYYVLKTVTYHLSDIRNLESVNLDEKAFMITEKTVHIAFQGIISGRRILRQLELAGIPVKERSREDVLDVIIS